MSKSTRNKNKKWNHYLFPSQKISQNERIKIGNEIKKLLGDYKFHKLNAIIILDECE